MLPRSRELLHEIVAAYIETGEPVASRSIARRRGDTLSAASVRNVMADLDEEGYLHQPHTSAGRIPTEKAFRSYVQSLTLRRMAAAGAVPINWLAVLGEWQRDWAREKTAAGVASVVLEHGGASAAALAWELQLLAGAARAGG